MSYGFLLICILIPLIFGVFLIRKFDVLPRGKFKLKYGKLYEGIKLANGKAIIFEILHYFFRRLVLGIVIVCQSSLFV